MSGSVRVRLSVALAVVLALSVVAAAIASVKPKAHHAFFYVSVGHFSITLVTGSPTRIASGKPTLGGLHPTSAVLIVCPLTIGGSKVAELHVGFPGATLKRKTGHYGFAASYTEAHAVLNVLGSSAKPTTLKATVRLMGKVASSKLITGTVSVTAQNCSLPSSTFAAR